MLDSYKNITKAVALLVKPLSARNRDIILRRFGLKTGRPETLEAIGQSYGITRERVRQIENHILKNLKADLAKVEVGAKPYFDFTAKTLSGQGGFMSEADLFSSFSGNANSNIHNLALAFLLSLHPDFQRVDESDNCNAFYANGSEAVALAVSVIGQVTDIFNKQKTLLAKDELYGAYRNSGNRQAVASTAFFSAVKIAKAIGQNIFSEYGLVSWSEVKPRGVRDRAYLVLKRQSKPKHFREITSLINTANFTNKKANVQTVHNELIKDARFVLVGRGIYGLSEWGYSAGTVKDVLVDILKRHGKSLPKAELINRVLSSRYVKPNTILLNLQDGKIFRKQADGSYSLREA